MRRRQGDRRRVQYGDRHRPGRLPGPASSGSATDSPAARGNGRRNRTALGRAGGPALAVRRPRRGDPSGVAGGGRDRRGNLDQAVSEEPGGSSHRSAPGLRGHRAAQPPGGSGRAVAGRTGLHHHQRHGLPSVQLPASSLATAARPGGPARTDRGERRSPACCALAGR